MMKKFQKNRLIYIIPIVIFVVFSAWWLYLRQFSIDSTRDARQLWGATYQILALYGAIVGLFISHKWGGYKSIFGRAIMFFSLGLFLQCFGQTYSSYYVFHYNTESPSYPGIGDIGFFGSIFLYIYGVILVAKVSGAGKPLKKVGNKVFALLIPTLILLVSYHFFLQGYEFDWTNKLKIFLDFGYPLGQALYVSIAILALLMSRKFLGGIMKKPILFLIFALLLQYFSDFFFLYQANLGNWYAGNINDYSYSVSYFIMSLVFLQLGSAFEKIKNS